MERFGEYLFDASSGSIRECLTTMGVDDVSGCSEYRVYQRGEGYYKDGMVQTISWKRSGTGMCQRLMRKRSSGKQKKRSKSASLMMNFILQLDEMLNRMSYDTFYTIDSSYPKFFMESEKGQLIEFIGRHQLVPETLVSRVYDFLAPGLNDSEKETILLKLTNLDHTHVATLGELYMEQNRYQESYDLILNTIAPEADYYAEEKLILIYLEVAKKLGHDQAKSGINAIRWSPTLDVLMKVKKLFGSVDEKAETLIRERSPEALLSFYEKEQRLGDALTLVMEPGSFLDSTRFAFFRRHGKLFPQETEVYLVSRIEKNLSQTGNSYYTRIAESLDLLKRINPERSARITEEIRTNFKRRPNLIKMLH